MYATNYLHSLNGLRDHQKPSDNPAMICQMPHHAAMKAIPPSPLNKRGLNISTKPKPEFWIPVSMVRLRLVGSGTLNKVARPYPEENAEKL